MFKVVIDHSEDIDTEDFVEDLLDQARDDRDGDEPKAGVLFACVEHDYQQLVDGITEAFPGIELIGCTTDAELSTVLGFAEDSVTLTLFVSDEVEFVAGVGRDVSKDPMGSLATAAKEASCQRNHSWPCSPRPASQPASTNTTVEVIEATDGTEGLDQARQHKPDIILMDVAMPEVGELEAAAMKEEEEIPRKISDAYLKKPVSKAQLVAELVRFLPHDEVEQDQAVTAPGVDRHWSPEELSEEQRAELPELQKFLADSVSIWQELSETLTVNDIEIFASQMQGAGHRFGFVPLENWGERLATQAALFGMASLPVTLGEFQQVQQDLDTLIGA